MILRRIACLMPLLFLLAACNIDTPIDVTPTVEILITDTPTPDVSATPSVTPSLTPTLTLTQPVLMLSPVQIATTPPVLENQPTVPPALPTEGPYTYTIQAEDTLYFILRKSPWAYANPVDPALIAAFLAINPDIPNENLLPPPGTEILIPRPTVMPATGNVAVAPDDGALSAEAICGEGLYCVPNTTFGCYKVKEGDTIVRIADDFNASLEMLSTLNQDLNWSGCQFNQASGGTSCNPLITIGACVNVPLPTPTPVPTGTPSGSETATPTPTFAPAQLVYPPEGAIAPAGIFTLQWVSTGILKAEEFYLVEVRDVTEGVKAQPWVQVTRDTAIGVPASLIPTDKQTHQFQWRVSVAKKAAGDAFAYIGGLGAWRSFQWQSR